MVSQQMILSEQLESSRVLAKPVSWRGPATPLASLGSLQVRLARSDAEIESAQRLRYRVFIEERRLQEHAPCHNRTDRDPFDAACDHLLVIDTASEDKGDESIVATCRLLPKLRAQNAGFYSEQEFDLQRFLLQHQDVNALELGRSCVVRTHRNRRAMELLWRGVWSYVQQHRIGLLFGCASLPSQDSALVNTALSYLRDYAAAPPEWGVSALPHCRRVEVGGTPMLAFPRSAFASLPPLLKAYLRLGANVATDAAEDKVFETTDVFVALRVSDIARRYAEHYSS